MPIDAFAVRMLSVELNEALSGGRIDKIQMPAKFEVHISGRASRGPFRLLLSAHPKYARAHLTTIQRENPQTPPMFCMLLRKHLTGARFTGLFQPPLERSLHFHFNATDELGHITAKTLVVEMIGRHSNVILVDTDGHIIDCLRRVDAEMSPQRPVLPGLFYHEPPTQNKHNLFTTTLEDFRALFLNKPVETPSCEWLVNTFTGISPILSRSIAAIPADCTATVRNVVCLYNRLHDVVKTVRDFDFTLYKIKDGSDFTCLPLVDIPQVKYRGTLSELMDEIYTQRDQAEQLSQKASAIQKNAKNMHDKCEKKLGYLQQELLEAKNREHLREKADLLMANLHLVERGAEYVTVENFYAGNKLLDIKLDPAKNAQQNAAAFYKAYTKAKNAEAVLNVQIDKTKRDIEYWDSVLDQLSRITCSQDLDEIRDEVFPQRSAKNKPQKISQPMRFRSSSGIIFRAGRNNRQNDMLTLKLADRNDVWLHTQKIPGCHVVIESDAPDEQTLYEAAVVAAWFSKARTSPKVPVDYTSVKYVKKPPAAHPGMVIYDRFKTILTEPLEETVNRLRID